MRYARSAPGPAYDPAATQFNARIYSSLFHLRWVCSHVWPNRFAVSRILLGCKWVWAGWATAPRTISTPLLAVFAGGRTFSAITSGKFHTCGIAVVPPGTVYCSGKNSNGQLGDGTVTERHLPVLVGGGEPFLFRNSRGRASHLRSRPLSHRFHLSVGGTMPMGSSVTAQRWTSTCRSLSTQVPLPSQFRPRRDFHSCGLSVSPPGAAYCSGQNGHGQLGDGTALDRRVPVAVNASGLLFASLVAGHAHTCGLSSSPSGAAYCWGRNGYGQLGDNTTTSRSSPVAVDAWGRVFVSLAAGYAHTCGLSISPSGAVYCWGTTITDSSVTIRRRFGPLL